MDIAATCRGVTAAASAHGGRSGRDVRVNVVAPNGTLRLDGPFVLDSGRVLPELEIAYESWGELSPERDNAVLICHSLTKGAHAAGKAADGEPPGWWDAAIGPG